MQKTTSHPSQIILFSLLAAAIATVLSGLILRHGMTLWPDSWAYWQGAVSLLSGKHYVYFFHDLSIKDWPPLYSIYLMAWQEACGVSVRTLIFSTIFLVGVATYGWCLCFLTLTRMIFSDKENRVQQALFTVILAFIVCYVSFSYQNLLSDDLKYALLPFLVYTNMTAVRQTQAKRFFLWTLASGLMASLLMLTHSGSFAFVAATSVILLNARFPIRLRISAVIFFVILSIVPWCAVEKALGQTSSHPTGWGTANFTPLGYARQILTGIGNLVAFHARLGLVLFAMIVTPILLIYSRRFNNSQTKITEEARSVIGLYSLFGVVALGTLFVVFNLTWIENPLDGRFLFFIPLMFIPLGLVLSIRIIPSWISLIFACLLLLPLLEEMVICIKTPGAFRSTGGNVDNRLETFLTPNCAIRYGIVGQPPFWSGSTLIVSPPLYPGQKKRLEELAR